MLTRKVVFQLELMLGKEATFNLYNTDRLESRKSPSALGEQAKKNPPDSVNVDIVYRQCRRKMCLVAGHLGERLLEFVGDGLELLLLLVQLILQPVNLLL